MNNDLISREALLENAQRMTEYDEAGWGVPVRVVKVEHIETAPAVDAVEVVHGKWELVTTKWMPPQLVRVGYCQNCNEERPVDNYCPNCGARMDGE